MRERFCPKEGDALETNPDVMVDKVAFHPSEMGVFQYLTPPEVAKSIERQKAYPEVEPYVKHATQGMYAQYL